MRADVRWIPFAAVLAAAASPAGAQRVETPRHRLPSPAGGLPPGRYTVKMAAPTLDPRLAVAEQVFSVCYTAADARARRNPVMPAAQAAGCKHGYLPIGDDLAFDDTCPDGYHRLRVFRINEASYQGTYRLLGAGKSKVLLEPTVQLRREGSCE